MNRKTNRVILSHSDVIVLKAFSTYVRSVVNPMLRSIKLNQTTVLYQISKCLGYKNYEELKKYSSSKVLFTDVYLYLSKTIEIVLFQLLDPYNQTTAKQKRIIKNISKHVINTFDYKGDLSKYTFDIEPPKRIDFNIVLISNGSGCYQSILFRSYLELALKLEQVTRDYFLLSRFYDSSLQSKTKIIHPIINSNYPVYNYIQKRLPKDSIFVAKKNELILGFDYIDEADLPKNFDYEKLVIMQMVFFYPSSFLYSINESKTDVEIECINPSFENSMVVSKNKTSEPQKHEGVLPIEALFTSTSLRIKLEEFGPCTSYKDFCDQSLSNSFSV